jgi:carbamoyl-phosphate synthase large subunit
LTTLLEIFLIDEKKIFFWIILSGLIMINILVTAIGGGGHGEQILKALLLAKSKDYRLIGADANMNCPQFEMVHDHGILPLANHPDYMRELMKLIEKQKIKVLFHGCEPELKVFSKNREIFKEKNIMLPINPTEVIDLCMDKEKTNQKLAELGFESPRYLSIDSIDECDQIDWYPVVVKPSVGGGGSANVYIAQNKIELTALLTYLDIDAGGIKFIIQEYVGTPEEEYTVGVLHDLNGEYINTIAVKRFLSGGMNIRLSVKNKTSNTALGSKLVISSGISQGQIGRFPAVTEQCKLIAKKIGAKGPINIQCRLVDGIVKVFEINPRFSGTTSLRAMVGYNEPDLLIRKHLKNEKIEADFLYEEAIILRNLNETKLI